MGLDQYLINVTVLAGSIVLGAFWGWAAWRLLCGVVGFVKKICAWWYYYGNCDR